MKEFEGTTYEEWLDYHRKVTYPIIVDKMIETEDAKTPGQRMMVINQLKKEKD